MKSDRTLEEKIKTCESCVNCKRTLDRGIVCKLTDDKPNFEDACDSYKQKRKAKHSSSSALGENDFKTFIRLLIIVPVIIVFFMTGTCMNPKEAYDQLFGTKDDTPPAQVTLHKPQFPPSKGINIGNTTPARNSSQPASPAPAINVPAVDLQPYKVKASYSVPSFKTHSNIVNPVKSQGIMHQTLSKPTVSYDPMEIVNNSREQKDYLTLPQ